jgi:hypothetical protein
VVDSAATMLGVALLIVTAVHISGHAATSYADEFAFAAAVLFLGSCAASHQAIARSNDRYEKVADKFFAGALVALFGSVLSFWL